MTKLFIDTNIYLDFYRAAKDRLSLFEELNKLEKNLIISEQGCREFQRNRTVQLTKLSAEIEKTTSTSIYTTALIQDMVEYQKACNLQLQIRKFGQELKKKIAIMLEPNPGDDPVFDAYENLTKICTFMQTEEELIVKAQKRKVLGNPPTSPDRHSVCDELLWEELIKNCDDNLIIVSNDKTFTENKKILSDEFTQHHPQFNLKIVKSVSEALQILGKITDRIESTEAEMVLSIKQTSSDMADVIMEIAIRKSSPIIIENDQEGLTLTIKNVSLGRKTPFKSDILDAIDELIEMQLIEKTGSNIYELTEHGRNYQPRHK